MFQSLLCVTSSFGQCYCCDNLFQIFGSMTLAIITIKLQSDLSRLSLQQYLFIGFYLRYFSLILLQQIGMICIQSNMGASTNTIKQSDGYFLNVLDQQNPRLSKKKEVAWLDFNLQQLPNQINKDNFETKFQNFRAFSSLQQLIEYENKIVKSQATLLMICAASLSKQCYEFIQKSDKIESIILFCMNEIKANILKQEYRKIHHICFSPADVIRQIKLWKSSQEKQFIIFSEKNVQFINKFNATLLSLTQKQFTSSAQALQDLKKYLKVIPSTKKQSIKYMQQILDIKDKKIKPTQHIIDIANQLLILTTSSNILGHIRYLISLLFNFIKEQYKKQKIIKNNVGFCMMKLKENERSLISSENIGKFMMITKFIRAQYEQQLQPTIDQVQLKIIFKKDSEKQCNGFHCFQEGIIINPGNYFQIVNYNRAQSLLEVVIYQFDPLLYIRSLYGGRQENKICLNRQFLLKQHQKHIGQSFTLILHNQMMLAQQNIKEKIQKFKNMQGKQNQFNKYFLALFYFKCKDKNNQLQLEKLLNKSNQSISKIMRIQFLQFLWKFSNKQTLKKYYDSFLPFKDTLQQGKRLKFQLLQIVVLSNLQEIQRIEVHSKFQQKTPCNMMLIFKIKLLYYEQYHRSKVKQQINIIEELNKLYKLCLGCTYYELESLINKKKKLIEVYQSQKKKEKNTSSINFKMLHQNEKYKPIQFYQISLKNIRLHLYQ